MTDQTVYGRGRHNPTSSRTSLYLEDIPRGVAEERLRDALIEAHLWGVLGSETIQLNEHAAGRVTSVPVWARISSPNYHAAAMDGFAVRSASTHLAAPHAPLALSVGSQRASASSPESQYVDTGDALPVWADAVIPVENVEALDEEGRPAVEVRAPALIRIRDSVARWSHVRPMGEDIVATQLVLPSGHVLRPVDLGAVAAAGYDSIQVARKPRVAIIPTGTELLPLGSTPAPGGILEYNSLVLAAQISEMGGVSTRFEAVRDDPELIAEAVELAARNHDLVLLNAGSSAGAEDFSATVIGKMGTVLVHGVAVRPGHPVILGVLREDALTGRSARPVIGVPGYPVSAALTLDIFVEPLLATWLGRTSRQLPTEEAELTRKITSPSGDEDHVRVAVGRVGDRLLAAPLASGAGIITSLVQADGIVVIPRGVQGLEAGERVAVRLYRTRSELDRTIFCIGSHDVTLDLLAQLLSRSGRRLVSANVGSQGGLIALRRGLAHLAGCHLLDPETGEYNISSLSKYLPGRAVKLVRLASRKQGLIVTSGNPKRLDGIADLARPDIVFVNRQRGAGTRVLLDYHLDRMGIVPESIRGYEQEEYTHLAIAAAVAGGRADCGLGIAAAAAALGLDFVPLFNELYDLVVPCEHADSDLLAPLLNLLREGPFRDEVSRLPGYDVSRMGEIALDDCQRIGVSRVHRDKDGEDEVNKIRLTKAGVEEHASDGVGRDRSADLGGDSLSQDNPVLPVPGAMAPDFVLEDESGVERTLSEFRGKAVILYFYPADDTPGCTKEACNFRDDYSMYRKASVVVLGISPDSARSHAKFKSEYGLPFTLLADPGHAVCSLYGVWGEKQFMGRTFDGVLRTTFLIDKTGRITRVFEKVRPAQHSAEILAELPHLT